MSERDELTPADERAIHDFNNRQWQELAAIGKRYGYGFMIQVAAQEWVRNGPHTSKEMAFWLHSFADGLAAAPPPTGDASHE